MKKTKKILDLFCGAGGLSLGFEQAGFSVEYANDIDTYSIQTYLKNRPNLSKEKVFKGDISNFIEIHKKELKKMNVDCIVGGPPCQGFSMANRQRLLEDPRNVLYKRYIDIVNMVRPKFVVVENVKGMLPFADYVVKDFEKIGYNVKYELLNAKNFQIPQNRERLIYIGVRNDLKQKYSVDEIFNRINSKKTRDIIPLKDAFWGLRKLSSRKIKGDTKIESDGSGYLIDKVFGVKPNKYIESINIKPIKKIYNHKARYHNERDLEIFRLLPEGGKSDHASIQHIMPYKNRAHIFKDKYYKLISTKESKTITAHMKFDCNMYIHPFESRGLTPREAARIQSFPDDYIFEGPSSQWYAQIGNAVPPRLGKIIAKSILDIYEK